MPWELENWPDSVSFILNMTHLPQKNFFDAELENAALFTSVSCQIQDFDSEEAVKFPKAQPLDSPKCQKWDSLEAQYALKSPNFGEFKIFELNDLWVIYQLWWEDNSHSEILVPPGVPSDTSKFHIDAASQDVIWISLHTI